MNTANNSFPPSSQQSIISYQCHNRLLIIATEEEFLTVYSELNSLFQVTWLHNHDISPRLKLNLAANASNHIKADKSTILTGYLGNFSLNNQLTFDLVIDFSKPCLINSLLPPPGYFTTEAHSAEITKLITDLPEMIGDFDKPKYFKLDTSKCAVSRSQLTGCHNCIDVCATDAIQANGESIDVNPYLCQGCGDCSSSCPSGAIQYNYPDLTTTLDTIKQLIAAFISKNQTPPVLVFHTAERTIALNIEADIYISVEAIGSVGIEIWLTALAYGAKQVYLSTDDPITPLTQKVLIEQMTIAHTLLKSMGYSIDMIQSGQYKQLDSNACIPSFPAQFIATNDKRTVLTMAITYLHQHAKQQVKHVNLPDASLFGMITLDTEACTLCLGCVAVCPSQALSAGKEALQLNFIEANCIQCGLCQSACPENAVTLQPRFLYNQTEARNSRRLHQEAMFHCLQCQKPFASETMINTILQKLDQHPMFKDDRKKQLMLCEDCRVLNMFEQ